MNDINFTFYHPDESDPDPDVAVPPSFDSDTGTFGFGIQTENNNNYNFMKSANLHEGSWYVLNSIWGDGDVVTVEDTNTQNSVSYYRVTPN